MYAYYQNKNQENNNVDQTECLSTLGNAYVYDNNKIWYVRHGNYTIRCSVDPITNRVIQQRIKIQSSVKKFADDYVNKLYQDDLKEKQKKNSEKK